MRGVNRGHRVWPSLLVACVLALGGLAEAIGPTLVPQVDEFIDAPRALFGRTRAEIERVLGVPPYPGDLGDRKSTRLNSSHDQISYAVFCLKKKNNKKNQTRKAQIQ